MWKPSKYDLNEEADRDSSLREDMKGTCQLADVTFSLCPAKWLLPADLLLQGHSRRAVLWRWPESLQVICMQRRKLQSIDPGSPQTRRGPVAGPLHPKAWVSLGQVGTSPWGAFQEADFDGRGLVGKP